MSKFYQFQKSGKAAPDSLAPGFHIVGPGTDLVKVSTRQQSHDLNATCFSSDLQEVSTQLSVLVRIPEANVVKVYTEYHGDPWDVLVAPRAQEAIKEATSLRSAEMIVKQREAVKTETLAALRKKLGDIVIIEDLVVSDVGLSKQLKDAIESKMVQEQEAAKAKFTTQKAEADAQTVIVKAKAEAEAIQIKGEALKQNQQLILLEMINKWDGHSPQIVSGSGGFNMIMPAMAGTTGQITK